MRSRRWASRRRAVHTSTRPVASFCRTTMRASPSWRGRSCSRSHRSTSAVRSCGASTRRVTLVRCSVSRRWTSARPRHLELNFQEMFESKVPLPILRGEFVLGRDGAVDRAAPTLIVRRMRGGYAHCGYAIWQIADRPCPKRNASAPPGCIEQS